MSFRYNAILRFFLLTYIFLAGMEDLCGQSTPAKKNGVKVEKIYFTNGNIDRIKRTKNGKLHGLQEEYFLNGQLKSKKVFKEGIANGKYITYNEKGLITSRGALKDGLKTGKCLESSYTGVLLKEGSYKIISDSVRRSVPHGKYIEYNYEGKIQASGEYDYGLKTGEWKNYTAGVLAYSGAYKLNLPIGKHITYGKNATVIIEANYMFPDTVIDRKTMPWYHGKYMEFDENGQMTKSGQYDRNRKAGVWLTNHKDGKIKEKAIFDGKFHQKSLMQWDNAGNQSLESYYKYILVDSIQKVAKDSVERNWSKGILIRESHYMHGKLNGISKEFDNNGLLLTETNYIDDQKCGYHREFLPDGTLNRETTYAIARNNQGKPYSRSVGWYYERNKDQLQSTRVYYNQEGESCLSIKEFMNKPHSINWHKNLTIEYSLDGKPILLTVYDNSNDVLSIGAYRNGAMRSLVMGDQITGMKKSIRTDEKGQAVAITLNDKLPDQIISSALFSANKDVQAYQFSDWKNRFFTDSIRNGTYVLKYDNGKTLLRATFRDQIPEGDFLALDAVSGDTLVYKQLTEGMQDGEFVVKFAGTYLNQRGVKKIGDKDHYFEKYTTRGIPISKTFIRADSSAETFSYDELGRLSKSINYKLNIFREYNKNGDLIRLTDSIPGLPEWRVNKTYNENGGLFTVSYSKNKLSDSTETEYLPDGNIRRITHLREGKKNGDYFEYDTTQQIIQKGYYKNDLKDSTWFLITDNKVDTILYKKGKVVLNRTEDPCTCLDTLRSADVVRFYPSLKSIIDKENFLGSLPKTVVPIDELNFDKLFMSDFQNSQGTLGAAFQSMSIVTKQLIEFEIPVKPELKITLNPCHTAGYLSLIPTTISFNYENKGEYNLQLSPKSLAMTFKEGPVKTRDDKPYYILFKDVTLDVSSSRGISASSENTTKLCAGLAVIRNMIEIHPEKASPVLSPSDDFFIGIGLGLSLAETKRFYGASVQEGSCSFLLEIDSSQTRFTGNLTSAILGGKFAAGSFTIPVIYNGDDQIILKDNSGKEHTFTLSGFKDLFLLRGFLKCEALPSLDKKTLTITFFAE